MTMPHGVKGIEVGDFKRFENGKIMILPESIEKTPNELFMNF